jgi:hypothetical protein
LKWRCARRGGGCVRYRDGGRDTGDLLVRDEFLLLACEATEAALWTAGQVGGARSRGIAASAAQRSEQVGGASSREGVRGAALRHAWKVGTTRRAGIERKSEVDGEQAQEVGTARRARGRHSEQTAR